MLAHFAELWARRQARCPRTCTRSTRPRRSSRRPPGTVSGSTTARQRHHLPRPGRPVGRGWSDSGADAGHRRHPWRCAWLLGAGWRVRPRRRDRAPWAGCDAPPRKSGPPVCLRAPTRGVVARILTGPHDANRQDSHLPMRYDTGRPRAVIRLRISQPRTTSLPCPAGLRARRPSPMMDLYRKNAFSTRP